MYAGVCFRGHGESWSRDIGGNYQLCGAKASEMEKSMELLS